MSEEGKSSGVIWICDLCGKPCKSDEERNHHTSETVPYHNTYTPIPEDQYISGIIHQRDEFVMWGDFYSNLQKIKKMNEVLAQKIKELQKEDLEVLEASSFKEWTPLNLLNHIWGFYLMQKKDDHYFDTKFQELMKDVETYLKGYQSTKTKWRHVIPRGEVAKRYIRLFEDDFIIINLEEKTLQISSLHDAFAYDVPLELFREYCKYMVDCNKCQYFENEGWKGKNCSECTFNPAFKDNFLPFETEN